MMAMRRWGGWGGVMGTLRPDVSRRKRGMRAAVSYYAFTAMRQCYQRGTDAACYCLCACVYSFKTPMFACEDTIGSGTCLVIKTQLYISRQIWMVFTLIVSLSPFLPLFAVTPSCWERCHGSGRELSDSLHPSISLNYGCAAEIANQPLRSAWRGGGDCVNIFWLTKMEGHSEGGGEGGQNIGRKSDVASEASGRKVLHLTEYALLSLILRLKGKGLQHIYSRLDLKRSRTNMYLCTENI